MNDNFFTSDSAYEHNSENTSVDNSTTSETTVTSDSAVTSEPYRYRYAPGECYDSFNDYSTSYTSSSASSTTYTAPKKKNPFLKAVKFVAGAACFGIISGAAFLGITHYFGDSLGLTAYGGERTYSLASGGGEAVPLNITLTTTDTVEGVPEPSDSVVVQVVDQNMAATVAVKSTFLTTYSYWGQQFQQESQGSGSGFIVGINDTELLIATNNHVIEDAKKIEITFIDDSVLEATIKGTDTIADLAIIAVPLDNISADTLASIRVATLGDSDNVRLGEMAIAIGNALGYGQSVTVGYISAKDREVNVDGNKMILLQTDAAINGGNSGGPLFNTRGEVIGINSVKYADESVEGMCFAIPISRAIPILNELMNRETLTDEEKGFLGVSTKTVTDDVASFYGWPKGAYIVSVQEGSPAEAANIYIGDIVTSINGVQITTADQLVDAISSYRYGTEVTLTVQRNINGKYEEVTLTATLAQKSAIGTEINSGTELTPESEQSGNSGRPSRPDR